MAINTEEVVTKYTIDASGARIEFDKVVKGFKQAEESIGKTAKSLNEFTSKMGAALNPTNILNTAIGVFTGNILTLATTAIPKLINVTGQYINEGASWNRLSNEYKKTINGISDATKNLIEDVASLNTIKRLNAAQIKLTKEEYESLGKAAVQLSRVAGIDTTAALEKLTDSLTRGVDRGKVFKQIGVDLNDVKRGADFATTAIAGMVEKYGNREMGLIGAMEKEKSQWVSLGDVIRDDAAVMVRFFDVAGNETMWTKIGRLSYDLYEGLKLLVSPLTAIVQLSGEIMNIEFGHARGTTSKEELEKQRIGAERKSNVEWAAGMFGEKSMGPQSIYEYLSPEILAYLNKKTKKSGNSGKGGEESSYYNYAGAQMGPPSMEDIALTESMENQKAYNIGLAKIRLDEKRIELLEKEKIAQGNVTLARKREADAMKEAMKYNNQDKEMVGNLVGAFADFSAGLWASADAAIQGSKSIQMAVAEMVKGMAFSLAQIWTAKGVAALAEGFMGQVGAFAAAAKYFAAAAIAGGIGLGMSAMGIGGGGGGGYSMGTGASGESSYVSNMNPYSPSYGREEKDRGPINVNVYLGDPSDPTAALLATKQLKATMAN